jgi:hypothetical protein
MVPREIDQMLRPLNEKNLRIHCRDRVIDACREIKAEETEVVQGDVDAAMAVNEQLLESCGDADVALDEVFESGGTAGVQVSPFPSQACSLCHV